MQRPHQQSATIPELRIAFRYLQEYLTWPEAHSDALHSSRSKIKSSSNYHSIRSAVAYAHFSIVALPLRKAFRMPSSTKRLYSLGRESPLRQLNPTLKSAF